MSNLSIDISNLKKKYREIFLQTNEALKLRMEEIGHENILQFLDEEILKEVCEKWTKILEYRNNFSCKRCATCCKLACSEFSYDQLQEKAKNGDNFATQFISIFIPYDNDEDAKKVYPEYFELLEKELNNEKVYFYHCPKLNSDNCCSDYENRPQICSSFPDNPLSLLPKTCGYGKWKEEVEPTALMLHALVELVEFYKKKLKN